MSIPSAVVVLNPDANDVCWIVIDFVASDVDDRLIKSFSARLSEWLPGANDGDQISTVKVSDGRKAPINPLPNDGQNNYLEGCCCFILSAKQAQQFLFFTIAISQFGQSQTKVKNKNNI